MPVSVVSLVHLCVYCVLHGHPCDVGIVDPIPPEDYRRASRVAIRAADYFRLVPGKARDASQLLLRASEPVCTQTLAVCARSRVRCSVIADFPLGCVVFCILWACLQETNLPRAALLLEQAAYSYLHATVSSSGGAAGSGGGGQGSSSGGTGAGMKGDLSAGGTPLLRKYAFHLIMAGHLFSKCQQVGVHAVAL